MPGYIDTGFKQLSRKRSSIATANTARLQDGIAAQRAENRLLLDELREEDRSADYVREQDQASFGSAEAANNDRIAVARKLTVMSEMNKRFVADRRLWQWIEEALKDLNWPLVGQNGRIYLGRLGRWQQGSMLSGNS